MTKSSCKDQRRNSLRFLQWRHGTPQKAGDRIRRELHAALGHTSVRARLRVLGMEKQPTSGEGIARFIKSESTRWQKVARDAGLTPE